LFEPPSNTFGNALGNAAIAGIERENAYNATKPAQAAIEINPGSPQLQVQDLNMPLAPIPLVRADQIVGPGSANSVVTTSDAESGVGSTVYMVNGREVRATVQVEPLDQVSMDGDSLYAARKAYRNSYVANALAENPYSATSGGAGMDPVTAQALSDYQAEKAQEQYLDNLDRANSAVVSQVVAGPVLAAIDGLIALPQLLYKGLGEYSSSDLQIAGATASLAGNEPAATQLTQAAEIVQTQSMQPAWVPFDSQSPGVQLGSYGLLALGLYSSTLEGIGLARGVFAADDGFALDVFGEVPNEATITSEGTANAATGPQLAQQLQAENLANIASQDSRLATAAYGDGSGNINFSMGTGTAAEADALGQIWVGDGAQPMGGVQGGWVSADGTMTYRPPQPKNSPFAFTGVQANFQQLSNGQVISNGHLNILL